MKSGEGITCSRARVSCSIGIILSQVAGEGVEHGRTGQRTEDCQCLHVVDFQHCSGSTTTTGCRPVHDLPRQMRLGKTKRLTFSRNEGSLGMTKAIPSWVPAYCR